MTHFLSKEWTIAEFGWRVSNAKRWNGCVTALSRESGMYILLSKTMIKGEFSHYENDNLQCTSSVLCKQILITFGLACLCVSDKIWVYNRALQEEIR